MPSNRLKVLVVGAIGLLALVVIGLGVVLVTMRQPTKPAAGARVTVDVSDTACSPNELSVVAGTPDFSVRNTSNRAIEWEILDGVMVLAERENIAPGFTVEVTPRLAPGSYQMTCGLLDNPRGKLTVVAAEGSAGAIPAAPALADLVAPTAEYRVFAIKSADELTTATAALLTAVKAGDVAAARSSLGAATVSFGHLAPIVHLFQHDADSLATGPAALSTLGQWLAGTTTPDTLAGAAGAAARGAATLGGTVHATTASPREIVAGAGAVVADLAKTVDDPVAAAGRIAGVRKVVDLFRPLTLKADKALSGKLDGDLGAVETALAKPAPDMTALKPQLADLGADLTDLLSALGLNAA